MHCQGHNVGGSRSASHVELDLNSPDYGTWYASTLASRVHDNVAGCFTWEYQPVYSHAADCLRQRGPSFYIKGKGHFRAAYLFKGLPDAVQVIRDVDLRESLGVHFFGLQMPE